MGNLRPTVHIAQAARPSSLRRKNKKFSGAGAKPLCAGRLALCLCWLLILAAPRAAEAQNVTLARVITTYAGNGTAGYGADGGAATSAELYAPWGVAVDRVGNLYIADADNNHVRKVDRNGNITTFAGTGYGAGSGSECGSACYRGDGGPATSATLNTPYNVTLDSAGNLYISGLVLNRIRMVACGTGGCVPRTGETAGHVRRLSLE